jgi:hypothetical protein
MHLLNLLNLRMLHYFVCNIVVISKTTPIADLGFQTFGDGVKHWKTAIEPQVFGQYGYKWEVQGQNLTFLLIALKSLVSH